ncbi:MAG: YihY/virulence factor BrkB family protein [Proteobacteria bacterium]|nr:YihY/virulence factor BrkB family protein [Pseudomonadota bacterium]
MKHLFDLCRKAIGAWIDDYAPSMGAAISYYTIFSLAPLLVIVIAVAGAIFGREAAQQQIVAQLTSLVGSHGGMAVQALLDAARESDKGLLASAISAVVLLVGATTVFAELQSALDRIWHVPEVEKPSGVWAVLRARLLSFGLILGLAFLLIVSLLISAGLAAFEGWYGGIFPGWEVLLQALNAVISLVIVTLLFAMIFKLMPTAPIAWRDVWIGAAVTAVLSELGKLLIGLYLGKSGFMETFAAAGSLVVLVAWVYYAAQIFLLGAEFTKVYADEHGSLSGRRAQQATEVAAQIKETGLEGAGLPVPVGSGIPDYSGLALAAQVQQEVDRRVQVAQVHLARSLLFLAVLTLVDMAVQRWSVRRQRRLAAHRLPL